MRVNYLLNIFLHELTYKVYIIPFKEQMSRDFVSKFSFSVSFGITGPVQRGVENVSIRNVNEIMLV